MALDSHADSLTLCSRLSLLKDRAYPAVCTDKQHSPGKVSRT